MLRFCLSVAAATVSVCRFSQSIISNVYTYLSSVYDSYCCTSDLTHQTHCEQTGKYPLLVMLYVPIHWLIYCYIISLSLPFTASCFGIWVALRQNWFTYTCVLRIRVYYVYMYIPYICILCIRAYYVYVYIPYTCMLCMYTCMLRIRVYYVYMYIMYTCILRTHVYYIYVYITYTCILRTRVYCKGILY